MARMLLPFLVCVAIASEATAQWDPSHGAWGKSHAGDLRVMTYNVADDLCSSADKSATGGDWDALARVVAVLQPDVLLLQEVGDNEGAGTGEDSDDPVTLERVLRVFVTGGRDPWSMGGVLATAYVRRWAPGHEMPFVAVSGKTDGYNRNAILSRHPLADLNGDGEAALSDLPFVLPHLYAPGGTGGIRGHQWVEIDLPGDVYAGDVVVGNCHLKAGTSASSHEARVTAAKNVAYVVEHWWNGAGAGVPDPFDKIQDAPPAAWTLDAETPVVLGGDWNEDELLNGDVKGPVAWLVEAEWADGDGGGDGPDRDGSDLTVEDARDPFTGSPSTHFGIKRDGVAWQDEIAGLRRAFVFDSATLVEHGAEPPRALVGFPGGPGAVSAAASDHRPVVVDLILPSAWGSYVLRPMGGLRPNP